MAGRYVGSMFIEDAPKTQQQASGILGIYSDPTDPLVLFAQETDPVRKAGYLMDVQRKYSGKAPGGYPGTEFDYIQALLRNAGISKSSTPLGGGMVGLEDSSALEKVILAGIASQQDPLTFLENYNTSLKGKAVKQPDTTTKYTKQIQTALNFKDLGDARQYYSDAYFTAWGQWPSSELDKKFQDSWNTQVKQQNQPTTTAGKTEYAPIYDTKSKPVIDPKTKKQKVDKFGNKEFSKIATNAEGVKRYTAITKGTATSAGEGFTGEEQTKFLADFLVENFPEASWNVDDIGGTAKTIYDTLKAYHVGNYDAAPDFATLSPIIKNMMSNPDEKVQNEIYSQYISGIQEKASGKFMSLKGVIKPGETANKYVAPLLEDLTNQLETNIDVKDSLAIQMLNYKDEKGEYRMPNEFEKRQLIMNDKRYDGTSTAINTAVNMAQSLKNALG
jgi:hypothetical protein